MNITNSDYIPRSMLPQCCGGPALCPYHEEVQRLRQEVVTDALTGLYNVGYFREALAQELERSERTLMPTALMMVDLDYFKQVNDNYGHEVGNAVLVQTAKLIKHITRKLDVQCRYGGEEFAVILPSTERFMAINVAQRLCEALASAPIALGDFELTVTASIGLAFYEPGGGQDVGLLINAADKFLYEAKHNGRNQIRYAAVKVNESAVSHAEKEALKGLFNAD